MALSPLEDCIAIIPLDLDLNEGVVRFLILAIATSVRKDKLAAAGALRSMNKLASLTSEKGHIPSECCSPQGNGLDGHSPPWMGCSMCGCCDPRSRVPDRSSQLSSIKIAPPSSRYNLYLSSLRRRPYVARTSRFTPRVARTGRLTKPPRLASTLEDPEPPPNHAR